MIVFSVGVDRFTVSEPRPARVGQALQPEGSRQAQSDLFSIPMGRLPPRPSRSLFCHTRRKAFAMMFTRQCRRLRC